MNCLFYAGFYIDIYLRSMSNLTKLELSWIGKYEDSLSPEPRILLEDATKSVGTRETGFLSNGKPWKGNMLIHGDNLLALRALEHDYSNSVKCIYIDPPYNTGSAFENYDDNLEHSIWLNLMRKRLIILRNLLSDDGFICCHIDDSEGHYLKVLMDEVFGRDNYLTTIYVRVRYPEKTLKQDMDFHKEIEYIHIYRKAYGAKPYREEAPVSFDKFSFYFTESENFKTITLGGKRVDVFPSGAWSCEQREGSKLGRKEIWATGTILDGNSSGRFFRDYLTGRYEEDGYGVLYKVYGIGDDSFDFRYFTGPQRAGATKGKYFQGVPTSDIETTDAVKYSPINNFYDLAGSFGNCRTEGDAPFRGGKKPEALLELILSHFTKEGDLVLDSFLGSGTTAAVAHKMKRRYIGVEIGDHAYTLCLPRLKSIVLGKDKTGITKNAGWKSGGGFGFYELAPSLLKNDTYGHLVINKEYNADMLAAAMAKMEGFTYEPSTEIFWKQGYSSETDFIFTTTQFVTVESLDAILDTMADGESLLVCCKAFQPECKSFSSRISVKKIPSVLLGRCEFDHDDYSLNIIELPQTEEEVEVEENNEPDEEFKETLF